MACSGSGERAPRSRRVVWWSVNEFCWHLVGAERMVGPEQQMLRTQHLIATGKRLLVIADGVNIKVGEMVADRAGKARRFGDERRRATNGFDAALEIGQNSAGVPLASDVPRSAPRTTQSTLNEFVPVLQFGEIPGWCCAPK